MGTDSTPDTKVIEGLPAKNGDAIENDENRVRWDDCRHGFPVGGNPAEYNGASDL